MRFRLFPVGAPFWRLAIAAAVFELQGVAAWNAAQARPRLPNHGSAVAAARAMVQTANQQQRAVRTSLATCQRDIAALKGRLATTEQNLSQAQRQRSSMLAALLNNKHNTLLGPLVKVATKRLNDLQTRKAQQEIDLSALEGRQAQLKGKLAQTQHAAQQGARALKQALAAPPPTAAPKPKSPPPAPNPPSKAAHAAPSAKTSRTAPRQAIPHTTPPAHADTMPNPGHGLRPGSALVPVHGRLRSTWHSATPDGPSQGISYVTPRNSLVLAPCAGKVVFAAPFNFYGNTIILDCGQSMHFVLAGLGTISADKNDPTVRGESIGAMGEGRTTLFVQLRHGDSPINPAPWLERGGRPQP
ncbi:peptidoglycan DD-metalloendopeptidase family protein [Formicincola oecophyllae]|uniref:Peptidoglycan DD-metalloendopeptidase family protein n=1 Tax=Formicincola oecophyllae TaxID=2558361 RepID=A0A4Y6U800_9PROT|nr:peptidoglycan DD-metalloendopeptidase family protein [Formicincola oecophyllae]QDH13120.1 peptidoglycan DD-metalloendopeptidase family protein [Formicincola oecophyllae]